MNHLAHFFLSCESEDLLIGNFIADYIRNKEVAQYNKSIQQGIFLHRQIDSFTDNHTLVRQSVRRLYPPLGKYAPVVLDVFYDYILTQHWHRYSGQSLDKFTRYVYEILERRMPDLPTRLQKRLPNMIRQNWLQKYGSEDGLRFVLEKMNSRTRFPSDFLGAVPLFFEKYDAYEKEFNAFFPELIAFVEKHCVC